MNRQLEGWEESFTVLIAEDDPDDRFLMEQVFEELGCKGALRFVEDGEELMDYLLRRGQYGNPGHSPQPSLILLDLNMPRKDGRQALLEIKGVPDLQKIPIIVWTTSDFEEDRTKCQEAGAIAYVTKPTAYARLVDAVRELLVKHAPQGDCRI
jgi:CheY-like chemotaxis protein